MKDQEPIIISSYQETQIDYENIEINSQNNEQNQLFFTSDFIESIISTLLDQTYQKIDEKYHFQFSKQYIIKFFYYPVKQILLQNQAQEIQDDPIQDLEESPNQPTRDRGQSRSIVNINRSMVNSFIQTERASVIQPKNSVFEQQMNPKQFMLNQPKVRVYPTRETYPLNIEYKYQEDETIIECRKIIEIKDEMIKKFKSQYLAQRNDTKKNILIKLDQKNLEKQIEQLKKKKFTYDYDGNILLQKNQQHEYQDKNDITILKQNNLFSTDETHIEDDHNYKQNHKIIHIGDQFLEKQSNKQNHNLIVDEKYYSLAERNETYQKQFEEFIPRKNVRITLNNGKYKQGQKFADHLEDIEKSVDIEELEQKATYNKFLNMSRNDYNNLSHFVRAPFIGGQGDESDFLHNNTNILTNKQDNNLTLNESKIAQDQTHDFTLSLDMDSKFGDKQKKKKENINIIQNEMFQQLIDDSQVFFLMQNFSMIQVPKKKGNQSQQILQSINDDFNKQFIDQYSFNQNLQGPKRIKPVPISRNLIHQDKRELKTITQTARKNPRDPQNDASMNQHKIYNLLTKREIKQNKNLTNASQITSRVIYKKELTKGIKF